MVDLTNPVIRATSTRTETPAACTEDGYTGDEANLGLTAEERAEMLPLLRAMLEDLPYWENNGWSNNQVRASQGARAFYDENGEPLTVGRNDPCPCGSGKKYKKCCGK